MHPRSSLSLPKSILRYPFNHSPKPISPILTELFSTHSNSPFSSPKSPIFPKSTSMIPNFNYPTTPIQFLRSFSTEFDKNKIVDAINLKFAEAREEIEAAMDSKETVYFNDEAECARAAVKEVLEMFDELLRKLEGQDREASQRSMGLKMEQHKAELQQLDG